MGEGLESGKSPIDKNIAKTAGELIAKYRKDYGLNPIDALIAAAALFLDAVLITRNKKHFDFINLRFDEVEYVVEALKRAVARNG